MIRKALFVLAMLQSTVVVAQSGATGSHAETDFEVAGFDSAMLQSAGSLGLDSFSMVGNPVHEKKKKWPEDLVIAPIPGRSPQVGWQLTLAGAYFLGARDEESNTAPSALGGFAMVAENGSSAYGLGASLHFLDDKLRIKAGGGYADIRYTYYGFGGDTSSRGPGVDILQKGPLYFANATWRVWKNLYVGGGYLRGDVESSVRLNLPLPPSIPDPGLNLQMGAYILPVEIDSRDHEQFPRDGWKVNGRALLYRKSAGSDFDAQTFKLSVNHYHPMREQDVLASRVTFRTTSGDAPFFLLSTFGGTDLRGYATGSYRDRMMYAMQTEYRWQYNDSWIFTGFVGFGEIAERFSDMGENFLPAAGIGLRYVLSKKHRVSLATDFAVGNYGTEFYVRVGEAF